MKQVIFSTRLLATATLLAGLVQSQSFPQPSCTKAAAPPPNISGVPAICGQKGTVKDPYGYVKQTADNLQQCQNMCLNQQALELGAGCVQFSYNANTKLCSLHTLNWKFTPNATSPVTVTDARCFDCNVCPNALGQNLINEGGLEGIGKYFGPWLSGNVNYTSIVHPGFNSNNALYTTCDNYEGGCPDGWLIEQAFNGCNGPLYKAEFDYKASYAANSSPDVRVFTGDLDVFLGGADYPTDQWRHYTSYFHANGNDGHDALRSIEYLGFFLHDQNAAARPHYGLYLDNLSVKAITKNLTVPASSPQLVPNGGFERGNLGPWKVSPYFSGSVAVKQPGINSKNAFYASGVPNPINDLYIYQAFPSLVPGAEYLVSFDYETTQSSTQMHLALGNTQTVYQTVCDVRHPCKGSLQWPIIARTPFGAPGNLTLTALFGDSETNSTSQSLTLDNIFIRRLS